MKYIILTKRHLTIMLTIILSVAVIGVGVFSFNALAASKRLLPIYSVEDNGKKQIALSFDATWGNEKTLELINILSKYKVKATFFVVGSWVDKYPETVKQLADAGHEVQNHSNSHPHMPTLTVAQMTEELNACNQKISAITGKTPILFRAPYGDYNNEMLETVSALNMFTVQWNIDSRDWKEEYTTDMIVKAVCDKAKPGSIVLFHNAAVNTPTALPIILEKLISEGYQFELISNMIYKDNYEINHDGTQVKKDG